MNQITIQTTLGQVYIGEDFDLEVDEPVTGMARITDKSNGKVYLFNMDNLIWIGPSQ